jgi:hypothetical protein
MPDNDADSYATYEPEKLTFGRIVLRIAVFLLANLFLAVIVLGISYYLLDDWGFLSHVYTSSQDKAKELYVTTFSPQTDMPYWILNEQVVDVYAVSCAKFILNNQPSLLAPVEDAVGRCISESVYINRQSAQVSFTFRYTGDIPNGKPIIVVSSSKPFSLRYDRRPFTWQNCLLVVLCVLVSIFLVSVCNILLGAFLGIEYCQDTLLRLP